MQVTSPQAPGGAEFRVKLDPSKTPREIDLGDYKGIYEIDGDDARIAFTGAGGKRPTDFDPKPGVFDNRLCRPADKKK
jgi:uncharacterized protein (TIGR03067 family)